MGGFEVLVSATMDPTVKYHSLKLYILTPTAKTTGDRIWRAVLVGRYPWSCQFARIGVALLWRLMNLINSKQIKLGGIREIE